MDERPEIIFFSEHKLGGVQTFYYNLIRYSETDLKVKWIMVEREADPDAKPIKPFDLPHEIFTIRKDESEYDYPKRLQHLVSDAPGAVVTNFPNELTMLHLHRKKNKTIYFICHDELYLGTAREFEFLIDCFIAHNPFFYEEMKRMFPHRAADIYYIPYGIVPHDIQREKNPDGPLRLLYLARLHHKKGIHELLSIDALLQKAQIPVRWTVIGNGPEKENFQQSITGNPRFQFYADLTNEEIAGYLSQQDLFLLPSRLDGVPLAMLETMSAGIVPIIYRFNQGIEMIFGNEATIVDSGDNQGIAATVTALHNDRVLLEQRSAICRACIHEKFNVVKRNKEYFDLFSRYRELKKSVRRKIPSYGGLLNHPAVPVFLRNGIRTLKKMMR
jgi:glycosyltransferase involved in cell wall biosynthesis